MNGKDFAQERGFQAEREGRKVKVLFWAARPGIQVGLVIPTRSSKR